MITKLKKFLKFLLYFHLLSFTSFITIIYLAQKGIKFTYKISENFKNIKFKQNNISIKESYLFKSLESIFPFNEKDYNNFYIIMQIIIYLNSILFIFILINFCIININKKENIYSFIFFLLYFFGIFSNVGLVNEIKKFSPLYDNKEDFLIFQDETLNQEFLNCMFFNTFSNYSVIIIQGISIAVLFIIFFINLSYCFCPIYKEEKNEKIN